METRSNYILVGSVVLALFALAGAALIFFAQLGAGANRPFDIFFKQSVDGLAKGSGVTYNGVPVGQIKDIALTKDPSFVRVRIEVDAKNQIRQGTTATIQSSFTGTSQIILSGGVMDAPLITAKGPYGVPVIPTKPGALGALLNSAPQLLERLSTLTERLAELVGDKNQASIAGILDNTNKMTKQYAELSPQISSVISDTRLTIQQAGSALDKVGGAAGSADQLFKGEATSVVTELKTTIGGANKTLERLEKVLAKAEPGIDSFSNQTAPEITGLVRDLRQVTSDMQELTSKLNNGGAGSLLGPPKLPDYKPGKEK